MIKIQRAHISKSYLKFRHVPKLSHSVYRGINSPSPQKHSPLYFLPSLLQIVDTPLFMQLPYILLFVTSPPPPLKIGGPP